LEAQLRGELPQPPLHHLTGVRVTEVGDGEATVAMPATEWLCSPARTVQGGCTAMLADAAIQVAIQSTTSAGVAFDPLAHKVNYLRPIVPDGREIVARAAIVHRGRSIAIANAEVTDADGARVALATGSGMYRV